MRQPWASAGHSARGCFARLTVRHAALGLTLAASVTVAPAARAELDLRWDAPPNCPERDEVLNRIRALAGAALDKTGGLSAEGKITRAEGRFWLTLLVRDGLELRKRVIESDSCADLAGAAAVTLALLLGIDTGAAEPRADDDAARPAAPDEGAAERQPAGGSDEVPGEARDARGREQSHERSDQRVERRRAVSKSPRAPGGSSSPRGWAFVVRAPIAGAELGPLPRPTLAFGVGVGLRYESWRVLLAGHVSPVQTLSASEPGIAFGAELRRMTGQLVACHGWRSVRFELAPCLGLALEHLTATGFGESVSARSQQALWPAPSAGVIAHWYAWESLAFFAGVTGYLELARPRLVIENLGEVGQLAPVAAGAAVGLEWIL